VKHNHSTKKSKSSFGNESLSRGMMVYPPSQEKYIEVLSTVLFRFSRVQFDRSGIFDYTFVPIE
jgi:hypothetical protein